MRNQIISDTERKSKEKQQQGKQKKSKKKKRLENASYCLVWFFFLVSDSNGTSKVLENSGFSGKKKKMLHVDVEQSYSGHFQPLQILQIRFARWMLPKKESPCVSLLSSLNLATWSSHLPCVKFNYEYTASWISLKS